MPPSKEDADPRTRVEGLLTRFAIRAAPVPVDRIAKGLGAQLRFSPLDEELSGMIYVSGTTPIIGVNSLHHPNRQRFTIAHEVAHLELHRHLISGMVHVDKQFPIELTGLNRDATSALGAELIEIQANRFASELLMPTAFVLEAFKGQPFDIDDEGPLETLARKFRVSRQALEYRIRRLAAAR